MEPPPHYVQSTVSCANGRRSGRADPGSRRATPGCSVPTGGVLPRSALSDVRPLNRDADIGEGPPEPPAFFGLLAPAFSTARDLRAGRARAPVRGPCRSRRQALEPCGTRGDMTSRACSPSAPGALRGGGALLEGGPVGSAGPPSAPATVPCAENGGPAEGTGGRSSALVLRARMGRCRELPLPLGSAPPRCSSREVGGSSSCPTGPLAPPQVLRLLPVTGW